MALFACLGLVSSCGLTLDYSPPDDGGFDAQLDARLAMIDAGDTGTDAASLCTSPCRMGSVCVEGRCVVPCSRPSDCRDDALCEVCADGFCAPAPLDLCGVVDGCFQTSCDPMADACGPGVDMCAPRSLACIGGTCMAQHCMDSAECSASHDPQGCPFVCDADVQLCAAPNHVCPPRRPGDCRAEDPCSCVLLSTADPSLCPSGAPICDPASLSCVGCVSRSDCSDAAAPACDPGSHRCVACAMDGDCGPTEQCELGSHTCVGCLRNTDCLSPGAGVCAPDTHRCVACVASRDCDATAGICDPASRTCVACLSGRDCLSPSASVCDPLMRRCRPCGADTECVGGMTCVAGMCRPRGCLDPGECPTVACAESTCIMNVCGFRNPNDMLCPEDGFGCTVDACRPGASFDSSGCVHEPQDSMCSDGFDCTDGLCRPGPGTGTSGCVHIPHDELCPTSGGLECAVSVCAAGEAGAVVDSRSGCGLTYGPCSLGGLCDTDGHCTAAARCGLMLPECDDGNPCNGVESCIAGFCGVVAPLECDLGGLCRSYCTTTGCGVRTLLPGGVICALSSP